MLSKRARCRILLGREPRACLNSGQDEIEAACRILREQISMTIGNKTKMEILPLYAALAQNQAGMELAKNFSHFLIYSEVCLGGKFEKKLH